MRAVEEQQSGHLQPALQVLVHDGQLHPALQDLVHEGQLQPDLQEPPRQHEHEDDREKETAVDVVLDAMPRVNEGMDV